jgi:hypothetical protein
MGSREFEGFEQHPAFPSPISSLILPKESPYLPLRGSLGAYSGNSILSCDGHTPTCVSPARVRCLLGGMAMAQDLDRHWLCCRRDLARLSGFSLLENFFDAGSSVFSRIGVPGGGLNRL